MAIQPTRKYDNTTLQRILGCSLAGIYIYDFNLQSNTYINPQYTKIIGHTLESLGELEQGEFLKLFHPDDLPAIGAHMEKVAQLKDGEFSEIEYRFHHQDGRWIWCLSRDTIFDRNEDGSVQSFLGTFLDITVHKDREQELERLVEKRTVKLEAAISRIRKLGALLPICAVCKKIRDDEGYWHQVESYILDQTGTSFSHGYCPECADKILAELETTDKL